MTLNEAFRGLHHTVSVADVYNGSDFNLYFNEKKFEVVDFRAPTPGELFIHLNGDVWTANILDCRPRLIVVKKPEAPTIKDIYGTNNPAIPEGYEQVGFRHILAKDIYLNSYGSATEATYSDSGYGTPHIILKRLPTLVFKPIRKGYVKAGEHYKFLDSDLSGRAGMEYRDHNIIAYRLEEQKD